MMYTFVSVVILFVVVGLSTIVALIGARNVFLKYVTDGRVDHSVVELMKHVSAKRLFFLDQDEAKDTQDLALLIFINWICLGIILALTWPLVTVGLVIYAIAYFTRAIFRVRATIDKLSKLTEKESE